MIIPEKHYQSYMLNTYQETRKQFNVLKQQNESKNNTEITELTRKLTIENKELVHSSFGLEHLFREMGKIYEACI